MNYEYKIYLGQKIPLYTKTDIEKIRLSGIIAYNTLEYISKFIKEGVSTGYLNDLCHKFILDNKAIPAPLNYYGFPKATCISVNEVVCHGIPNEDQLLKSTDILNIDITTIFNGFYGDTSRMYKLNNADINAINLINVTYECLMRAIDIVKPGTYLGDIGYIIQEIAHKNGFSVVEDFCGHGTGHVFHQAPQVLHFGKPKTGLQLEEGMVFTIEPMINSGSKYTKVLSDKWTAVTTDKSLSAQFEHTIAVTNNGYDILTLPNNKVR